MKNLFLLTAALLFLISCDSTKTKTRIDTEDQIKLHKAIVEEVIQTTKYTYLLVAEDQKEYWTAIAKQDFNKGDEFFYLDDVVTQMVNFHSQELNRDFSTILFISQISKQENVSNNRQPAPIQQTTPMQQPKMSAEAHSGRKLPARENISVEPVKGGISIAKLYGNKEKYSGQKVKIKGNVVKVNQQIMGRNWIHLQDGSNYGEEYDLTCTTQESVSVGDIITLEGRISLNKDFSSGYFYPVIMEEATLVD